MAACGEMRIVFPSESRLETNGISDVQETGMVRRSPFSRSTRTALSPKLCSTPTSSLCHGCTASTIVVELHPVRPHLVAVWLEVFQPHAIPGRNTHTCMDAVARHSRITPAGWQGLHIHRISHSRDAAAGTRAGGDSPRDQGTVQFGKQRLVVPQPVGFVGIRLRPKAAALEKLGDTVRNAICHTGDFSIAETSDVALSLNLD